MNTHLKQTKKKKLRNYMKLQTFSIKLFRDSYQNKVAFDIFLEILDEIIEKENFS
jgi:hypothetical protein